MKFRALPTRMFWAAIDLALAIGVIGLGVRVLKSVPRGAPGRGKWLLLFVAGIVSVLGILAIHATGGQRVEWGPRTQTSTPALPADVNAKMVRIEELLASYHKADADMAATRWAAHLGRERCAPPPHTPPRGSAGVSGKATRGAGFQRADAAIPLGAGIGYRLQPPLGIRRVARTHQRTRASRHQPRAVAPASPALRIRLRIEQNRGAKLGGMAIDRVSPCGIRAEAVAKRVRRLAAEGAEAQKQLAALSK